jgi:D-beta-D-heptose 7-phosphate kinase/D-beta-D-heptose 1-phosphate adenosyltransferase
MSELEYLLEQLHTSPVLCIGDVMLDEFLYGSVTRISPEAATPILTVERQEIQIGGAGNVARNIARLGAKCIFLSVVGADGAGKRIAEALKDQPLIRAELISDPSRRTTRKTRLVSEHHSTHLLRADWESSAALSPQLEETISQHVKAVMPEVAAVILSDYDKGVLTERITRNVIDLARAAGKPVVVDPKGRDFTKYRGATLITPNLGELGEATGKPVATDDDVAQAAGDVCTAVQAQAVLVTRSEQGMTLSVPGQPPVHIPAISVRVRDVSGAGDTVAAVLALAIGGGASFEQAMRLANAAASVAVGKRGTATVSLAELRARVLPHATLAAEEKIVRDRDALERRLSEWRREGLRVGFTNGCFDLLHPGHIQLLTRARSLCDRLIVGLNSDMSVRQLKGAGRPIQHERARAEVLAALEAVDLVVIFEERTPLALIEFIGPKVLVKGADYRPEDVVGREIVEQGGGQVVLVDLVPGQSTSGLVRETLKLVK